MDGSPKSALRLLRNPGLGARYGRTGRESQSKLTRRSIAARQGRGRMAALLFIQPDVLSDPGAAAADIAFLAACPRLLYSECLLQSSHRNQRDG